MNWDAISFDWNHVRAFLATAEEGSFSGAARVLQTTQPTIGRQITELEERLGATLIERNVRGPALTETGQALLHHVRSMAEAATLLSMTAEAQAVDVTGEVTVTATDLLAAEFLPNILLPLWQAAPGLRIKIVASNSLEDLLARDADIAIRHVRPEQPDLFARHVGDFRANLYAARSYLDRVGWPSSPAEVAEHSFVGLPDPERLLAPLHAMGIPLQPEAFIASSDSGVVMWQLLRAGAGISVLPEALCARESGVEKVLPDLPSLSFPNWLVSHRELQTSRRIRLVFDHLAEAFRQLGREG